MRNTSPWLKCKTIFGSRLRAPPTSGSAEMYTLCCILYYNRVLIVSWPKFESCLARLGRGFGKAAISIKNTSVLRCIDYGKNRAQKSKTFRAKRFWKKSATTRLFWQKMYRNFAFWAFFGYKSCQKSLFLCTPVPRIKPTWLYHELPDRIWV